jgi:hypothetical protein
MIPFRGDKHLGFEFQAAEALAVKDAVPVPLKLRAEGTRGQGPFPPLRIGAAYGEGRKIFPLPRL